MCGIAGVFGKRDRRTVETRLAGVLDLFPALKPRLRQSAGTLSGGEQQMVAIGGLCLHERHRRPFLVSVQADARKQEQMRLVKQLRHTGAVLRPVQLNTPFETVSLTRWIEVLPQSNAASPSPLGRKRDSYPVRNED